MTYPWLGAARPLSPQALEAAAQRLGCEPAAIRAVWEVEAAGQHFLADGSLVRRFEPHHFPRRHWVAIGFAADATAPWRASLRLDLREREQMLRRAFAMDAEAALHAASWGAPQIMGFNAAESGFDSAREMVEAMAGAADRQVEAFCALIEAWGLAGAVRGHDWRAFARRYNGYGQVAEYARRMEAAYRRHAGGARSSQVLRVGDRGTGVRRLQRALEIEADGACGPQTLAAVERFQASAGLPVDGVVGARSWAALESKGAQPAPAQDTPADAMLDRVHQYTAAAGAVAAAIGAFQAAVPDEALVLLLGGAMGLAAIATVAWAVRRVRA
jgi:hypothetical protein